MDDKVLIAQIDDARNDSVNDAAGLLVLADGSQAAESRELGSTEVQLDSFIVYRCKVKKCRRCLLFLRFSQEPCQQPAGGTACGLQGSCPE